MDCGANDELMELSGFGGGGVGDLRGVAGDDGRRSPGFGDTGCTTSGFDAVAAVADVLVLAETAFNAGGGGIIPLL